MTDADARPWAYHVQISIEGDAPLLILSAMHDWLTQLNIPYRAAPATSEDPAVQVSFSEEKYARAFEEEFGVFVVSEEPDDITKVLDFAQNDLCQIDEAN